MADPVWLLLMFDLPVVTKSQRREATQYRKMLLDFGFDQVQLSVYCKYVINASGLRSIVRPIKHQIPLEGQVRVLQLTDTQWASQYRFWGPASQDPEKRPEALELFDTWDLPGSA
ncbi:CRISPR-associated endonuclease Cas2 [Pseudoclavibacter sp. CFCC 11306]|uniref:CRISPR-associated endonuclease Cas2 n=1 Tax=Pseudoclavibacter sp. CFCC 11306 TaxID=1564493 RepID=UPI0013018200|nr:CRISPR-associated endonuclease Cas2 [Pseudoclavibacter sp. CFCC 11306]KAB1656983.1 CRISPR-associated endonuclease Cas2 [Pseudoclavibacter sp. CFCC 11306]